MVCGVADVSIWQHVGLLSVVCLRLLQSIRFEIFNIYDVSSFLFSFFFTLVCFEIFNCYSHEHHHIVCICTSHQMSLWKKKPVIKNWLFFFSYYILCICICLDNGIFSCFVRESKTCMKVVNIWNVYITYRHSFKKIKLTY